MPYDFEPFTEDLLDDSDYIEWYEDPDRLADFDQDDEPDTTQDGFPHETDLENEWL